MLINPQKTLYLFDCLSWS